MPKGKPLTMAMLELEPKGSGMMSDDDESEGDDNELPPGLEAAISEFRNAEDDKTAAEAFHRAMKCCD